MDELARMSPADRSAVFAAAAAGTGYPVHIIEKDFWVCWVLKRLFDPPLVAGMVFKGGTSLSKGYDLIARFSEDVDLTLPRTALPALAEIDLLGTMSNTQRKKASELLGSRLADWCAGTGREAIARLIGDALDGERAWRVEAGGRDGDTLFFHYPRSEDGYEYIAPAVRLEFGARMPVEPWEEVMIAPFCASAGEFRMERPDVGVRVLAPRRTFWEKVTLIHAKNNGPAEAIRDRVSRHYADVATLWDGEIGAAAIADIGLLTTVAADKELLYRSGTADYPAAARGQLRLVPSEDHEKALRLDYRAMREMYLDEPLSFDVILERMREIETAVRADFGR